MGEFVILAADVLVDENVLALVVEDNVHLLGAGPADIRAEHDVVLGVAVHVLLAQASWEELDVAPAAVDVLLVLHRELHHQRLVAVAEGLEARREGVETGVLARLDPFVLLSVAVELAGGQHEAAVVRLVLGFHPPLGPGISIQELLPEELRGPSRRQRQEEGGEQQGEAEAAHGGGDGAARGAASVRRPLLGAPPSAPSPRPVPAWPRLKEERETCLSSEDAVLVFSYLS